MEPAGLGSSDGHRRPAIRRPLNSWYRDGRVRPKVLGVSRDARPACRRHADYLTVVRALLASETVTYEGPALRLQDASLGVSGLPRVPVYLGALGPQMLRLAGELGDGALLNWATADRIAESRRLLKEGATRAGRDPAEVTLTMYIRVCVDDDIEAARQALGKQVLSYAMAQPGAPLTSGYLGLFAEMGFGEILSELEERKESGEPVGALVSAVPDEFLKSVGYFGSAAAAPEAFGRLSQGLDEAIVRIMTARPGLEPVLATLEALTPERIRKALEVRGAGRVP